MADAPGDDKEEARRMIVDDLCQEFNIMTKSRIEACVSDMSDTTNDDPPVYQCHESDGGKKSDREITNLKKYQQRAREKLDNLTLSAADRTALERDTRDRGQAWEEARRGRITASQFLFVSNMNQKTSCKFRLNTLLYPEDLPWHPDPEQEDYEKQKMNGAIKAACEQLNSKPCKRVNRPVGLMVHPEFGFLAATPHGWVDDDAILRVRCPIQAQNCTLREAAEASNRFCLELVGDELRLRETHHFYYQVQAQMACCGVRFCDFFVWSPQGPHHERIEFDPDFWEEKLPKVREFFLECVLPEMVDPRKARDLPFRERQSYTP